MYTTYFSPSTGQYINRNDPFVLNDIQYPYNWLDIASDIDIINLGLIPVITIETQPIDYQYYNRTESLESGKRIVTWTRKTDTEIREIELNNIKDVSPRQLRQALTQLGLRQNVENLVSTSSQDIKDWWEFATSFSRRHPLIDHFGTLLGQNSLQLDALWKLAGTL